ncbi:SOS response-associated peptidase [Helcobacillus massiliensis]|uniref:Abasic site processing protein n=1 Tax=Helcobacillus massiliensis TaxID=521392 RepID=A0A839QTC2_9MICO|nr:SOS response-associated peptidase [Helcobacillus massiliensis]MBB3022000.1 putative SOS response-associated peptidase YedK [Helcobacillus massiliensis]MCT1557444.1 SOS response-associated peptidase [Helcobacillus massiliensis]MCT2036375.1 SOS response-associated peptidase [Helcobacillus massiliensis]MCT2331883.1 SOS response-associated peptidase [Helcobacillus massiliensis]MDK7742269.1 SOS response-associated peptidase [Helcobacillus massiliensis]
MCGRFAFHQEIDALVDDLDAVDLTDGALTSRFNIPPTAPIHIVTESVDRDTGELVRALRIARWGLLPPFAKDEAFSSKTFNARAESLADKPSFRGSLKSRRAIIPVSGYYEWTPVEGQKRKQANMIRRADHRPMLMAGLVAWWKGEGKNEGPAAYDDGEWLLTATIITAEAEGSMAQIHSRIPVILTRDGAKEWLKQDSFETGREAHDWINTQAPRVPNGDLEVYAVDPAVGNVQAQGPHLMDPV